MTEHSKGPYEVTEDRVHQVVRGPGIKEYEHHYCIPENDLPSVQGLVDAMNLAHAKGRQEVLGKVKELRERVGTMAIFNQTPAQPGFKTVFDWLDELFPEVKP